MALSTLAGSRAAKKKADLDPFGGEGADIGDKKLSNINKSANSSVKVYAQPEQIDQQVGTSAARVDLKYPLDTSYLAYIQYRTREVVPPDFTGTADELLNKFNNVAETHDKVYTKVFGGGNRGRGSGQYLRTGATSSTNPSNVDGYDEAAYGGAAERKAEGLARTKALKDKEFKNRGGQTDLLAFKTQYTNPEKVLKLYMPQAIQVHDNVQYDQVGLGIAAASGLNVLNRGGGMFDAIGTAATEFGRSVASLFGSGDASLATEVGRVAAARGAASVKFLTPAPAQAALGLGLQVKVNPSTRSVFTGVSVRNFSFIYDFYPVSAEESEEVKEIIKTFRKEMYPLSIPAGAYEAGFPLGYKFPNLFEIKFRIDNANIEMPQPLFCFCRDVSTTYNPGQMTFHSDGKPTHIQMNLQFQEFRALNQQDIDKGH